MYNFDTDDNYTLSLEPAQMGSSDGSTSNSGLSGGLTNPAVSSLAFDERYQMLAAGTVDGRVCCFRHRLGANMSANLELAKAWEAQPAFQVSIQVHGKQVTGRQAGLDALL